jgi:hypothetical protein
MMPTPPMTSRGFTVLALSRGSGVPESTVDGFAKIMALLHEARQAGANIQIATDKIGLEGETRLCVDFTNPTLGGRLFTQVNALTQGLELINVTNEPCSAKQQQTVR